MARRNHYTQKQFMKAPARWLEDRRLCTAQLRTWEKLADELARECEITERVATDSRLQSVQKEKLTDVLVRFQVATTVLGIPINLVSRIGRSRMQLRIAELIGRPSKRSVQFRAINLGLQKEWNSAALSLSLSIRSFRELFNNHSGGRRQANGKRGRPRKLTIDAETRKIVTQWKSGKYKTHTECETANGLGEDAVANALRRAKRVANLYR